jgi:hypothetical protein
MDFAGRTDVQRAARALALSAILVAIAPGQATAATWSPALTISTETTQNDLPGLGFGSDGVGLGLMEHRDVRPRPFVRGPRHQPRAGRDAGP